MYKSSSTYSNNLDYILNIISYIGNYTPSQCLFYHENHLEILICWCTEYITSRKKIWDTYFNSQFINLMKSQHVL